MKTGILNHDLIIDNDCFGCGAANPHGLHIELRRDPKDKNRLIGILNPTRHMTGFFGITHGGIIYSAMDCLAAWVPKVLRPDTKALWVLRSATMTYHRPAKVGEPIHFVGSIEKEEGTWDAMMVKTEAFNSAGELLNEGHFKVIPLPAEKFKKVAGLKELPPNWEAFLDK